MGTAVENLLALAGTEHVGSYQRVSKTGKTVHVDAYTRDPGKMANIDLFHEFRSLSSDTPPENVSRQQAVNRKQQVLNEIRKRQTNGSWEKDAPHEPPGSAAPAAPEAGIGRTGGANASKPMTAIREAVSSGKSKNKNFGKTDQQVRAEKEKARKSAPEQQMYRGAPAAKKPAKDAAPLAHEAFNHERFAKSLPDHLLKQTHAGHKKLPNHEVDPKYKAAIAKEHEKRFGKDTTPVEKLKAKVPGLGEKEAKKGVEPNAAQSAENVFNAATEAEPSASKALQDVVSKAGGKFFGWEHRLKTKESLSRKIKDRAENRFEGEPDAYAKAEDAMGDSLRYTVVAKPENYTEMAKNALAELEKAGHKVAKVDNFWGDKGAYFGVHADMVAPSGLKWELQFHTPDSMTRKDASHFWYDFFRDRDLPSEVRTEAKERSAGAWKGLERPKDWEGFGTQVFTPTKDTHIGGEAGVMNKDSVPPSVTNDKVSWGGYHFVKTSTGWIVDTDGGGKNSKVDKLAAKTKTA